MGKLKKKKRPVEYQSYIFQIEDWETSYSFATNHDRWSISPYWEHVELVVTGSFLHPERLEGRDCTLKILGDRKQAKSVQEPDDVDFEPRGVGSFTIRGDYSQYLSAVPFDTLWGLASALGNGAIKFVTFRGEPLKYGKAMIRSVGFVRDLDLDDYV